MMTRDRDVMVPELLRYFNHISFTADKLATMRSHSCLNYHWSWVYFRHTFLPLYSTTTPGGPSLSFALIPTQCHALSTYSTCPFHTNSTQKWSSDRAQLGPHSRCLTDERRGEGRKKDGGRKGKREEEIRHTEIQTSSLRISMTALMTNFDATIRWCHQRRKTQVEFPAPQFGSDPRSSSTFLCCPTCCWQVEQA